METFLIFVHSSNILIFIYFSFIWINIKKIIKVLLLVNNNNMCI